MKMKPYILTLSQVVKKIRSLDFRYLTGGSNADIREARNTLPFAPVLNYARLPLEQSQICWKCGTGKGTKHSTNRSLSIFPCKDGHEAFKVRKCNWIGDVVEAWKWIVDTCYHKIPNPSWSMGMAARDLLTRKKQGLFDLKAKLIGTSGSHTKPNDPIYKYWRKLEDARAICESRTYNHPSIRLPHPIIIPYQEVINAKFKHNRLIWIADELNHGRAHLRNYYTDRPRVQDASYYVPSYLKKNWRNRENMAERISTVIEMDDRVEREQQHWVFLELAKYVPLLSLVNSGGRSLHADFDTSGMSLREIFDFYLMAVKDFGVDDTVSFMPEQAVRFPGGLNRKHNKRQDILIWNS